MKIWINGEEAQVTAATVAALLQQLDIDPLAPGIAVAHNGQVVPKARLAETEVDEGDRLEIVRAVQGG